MSTTLRTTLALALLLPGLAVPARAQAKASPTISVTALNTTARAEAQAKGGAARTAVQPNDVLRYTLTFSNATDKPVHNVELRDPIPAGVRFVPGSAHASRADARLEFSADGGRTWSAAPSETVTVDGRSVVRAIPAERFTHVRWVVAGAVAPRATVTADFEARVARGGA